MDCDTKAVCLTAVGVNVGVKSLRGTYRLHHHGVLEKFRNNWCDMIMGSLYIKSMSLAPVCLPLPRNAVWRIWPWIMYLMYLSLEGAVEISTHKRLRSPKLRVTSWTLYMALFSKHCLSHYHHHMLIASSPLINAPVLSHLRRFSRGKPGGAALKRNPQGIQRNVGSQLHSKSNRISLPNSHEGLPLNR